jgi:hypothetical protein
MRTGTRLSLINDGAHGAPYSAMQHQIKLVGVRGFEPRTFCSQGSSATRLRHTPKKLHYSTLEGNQGFEPWLTVH